MTSIIKKELEYCSRMESSFQDLERLYADITKNCKIDIKTTDITKAILLRMKEYYVLHDKIKNFLNKGSIQPASDFFVETVMFYLKLFLEGNKKFEVYSEKPVKSGRCGMRPDISIWKDDKIVATLECKTQLGWNRIEWKSDFDKREKMLQKEFPQAKSFLLVMTSVNWSGFKHEKEEGNKYFALSSIWPGQITEENIDAAVNNPIEHIFQQLRKNI